TRVAGSFAPGYDRAAFICGPAGPAARHTWRKDSPVPVTVRQLAEWAHGQVDGDGDLVIVAARPLAQARPRDVTFAEDDKHLPAWPASPASAAVVPAGAAVTGKALVRVADPLTAFCEIVRRLHGRPERPPQGIHPFALVHPSVRFEERPDVGAFVTI